jgi:hypothetical protein
MGKEEFSVVFSVVCTLMKTLINNKKLKSEGIIINKINLATLILADNQAVFSESVDNPQIATNQLEYIMNEFNLKISLVPVVAWSEA